MIFIGSSIPPLPQQATNLSKVRLQQRPSNRSVFFLLASSLLSPSLYPAPHSILSLLVDLRFYI
jgi:hypothetical protein